MYTKYVERKKFQSTRNSKLKFPQKTHTYSCMKHFRSIRNRLMQQYFHQDYNNPSKISPFIFKTIFVSGLT